ncbi:hypothetical protein [Winogradskyella forsetii]|uniref:hypothetical protein n=1 Tax=Winogradskyella forsetii TaxID=2686077 RepID=UPI0015C1C4F5|nr:hypothetical protein [Winogradskyella forsetii]
MNKKIDSTLYFFQYLTARVIVVGGITFLIYCIIAQEVGAIVFCSIFVLFGIFILKKQVPKPTDLSFDKDFLYLDHLSDPIRIENISSLENGVILYNLNGKISKIILPNFYYIDKNYKKLKAAIENKSTQSQRSL